jgi:hypothetical protein
MLCGDKELTYKYCLEHFLRANNYKDGNETLWDYTWQKHNRNFYYGLTNQKILIDRADNELLWGKGLFPYFTILVCLMVPLV